MDFSNSYMTGLNHNEAVEMMERVHDTRVFPVPWAVDSSESIERIRDIMFARQPMIASNVIKPDHVLIPVNLGNVKDVFSVVYEDKIIYSEQDLENVNLKCIGDALSKIHGYDPSKIKIFATFDDAKLRYPPQSPQDGYIEDDGLLEMLWNEVVKTCPPNKKRKMEDNEMDASKRQKLYEQ